MAHSESSSVDVVVIGGGIIGLAVAWRARERGLSVAVLERGEIGEGASHVAAGMLAPVSEVEFGPAGRRVLDLGLRSVEMWPGFASELHEASGIDVGLRRTGTLVVAHDEDSARELERQLAFRRELGVRAIRLRASEARDREPALAPTVRLAMEAPDDHSVDPRLAVRALALACEHAGVELHEHAPVTGVELDGKGTRVTGVIQATPHGGARPEGHALKGTGKQAGEKIGAGHVLIAAGAWCKDLEGLPSHARVPVRPVKGQIMRVRDPAGAGMLERAVRFEGGYIVPRGDGRYVIGATMEERGFEPDPSVGGVYELLRNTHELIPSVSELHIEEVGVGYRPSTPDNTPAIGLGALDGLVWATGHHRNGILLAPLTAEMAVASIVGDTPTDELHLVSDPARFAAAFTDTRAVAALP